MKLLAKLLVLLCLALTAEPTHAAAEGVAMGRLQMARPKTPTGPPPPGPPADQTVYFGPWTLDTNGGADVCQGLCTLPVSMADTSNYYYDPTQGTQGLIVPKSSSSKTYNAARSVALSGCETATLNDSASHTVTIHACADRTIAGDYTVRWRNGDTFNSITGTNQLFNAFKTMTYGQEIAFRGGTYFNTIFNTGASGFNGTSTTNFTCNVGTCLTPSNFTGSNYKVIRPELGTTVMLGPMAFQNSGLTGTKVTGFVFDGEDTTICIYSTPSPCTVMIGAGGNTGATDVWIDSNTIIGNPNDTVDGRHRIKGIKATGQDIRWKVTNNAISWVYNGIQLSQSTGSYPTDEFGIAPSTDPIVITGNTLSQVSSDVLDTNCMRYATIEDNVITDKASSVIIDGSTNPFNSSAQVHSDFMQNDYQDQSGACVYKYYPGISIQRNYVLRGNGRDRLPFWTVPPYPSVNSGGSVSVSDPQATPNPLAGLSSGQGIYASNFCGTDIDGPTCDHKYPTTAIKRTYGVIWKGAVIKDNVVVTEAAAGINIPDIEDATFTGNVAIAPNPNAFNLSLDTWNYARTSIRLPGILGTSVVDRNIAGGTPVYGRVGANTYTGTNVTVDNHNLPAAFQNSAAVPNPRSAADYLTGYKPIKAGSLEIDHALHIYAGRLCWDGSTPVAGVCPP